MSPTIRIDDEVYSWLQKNARPFEDTPNSVLRRLAGLNDSKRLREFQVSEPIKQNPVGAQEPQKLSRKNIKHQAPLRMTKGVRLNEEWKVGARHALYHRDGFFYENLEYFPGALFDPNGYVLFKSKEDYLNCPYLQIGVKTNVPKRIASMPGYVRKTKVS